MLEMASFGAGVMHPRAVEFGKKYDVKIHVRSSSNETDGTIITHEVPQMEGVIVSGATVKKDMAKVGLVGVDNVPGSAAKVFAHISDLAAAKKAVEQIKEEVNCESIFVRDVAEVSVVGIGMRTHYGVADKMFSALAKAKVNIDSITTSEIRISCAVDKDQAEKALEAVCTAFELDKPAEQRSVSD